MAPVGRYTNGLPQPHIASRAQASSALKRVWEREGAGLCEAQHHGGRGRDSARRGHSGGPGPGRGPVMVGTLSVAREGRNPREPAQTKRNPQLYR